MKYIKSACVIFGEVSRSFFVIFLTDSHFLRLFWLISDRFAKKQHLQICVCLYVSPSVWMFTDQFETKNSNDVLEIKKNNF